MTAARIYRKARLTETEIDLVESYVESDNDGEFMSTSAYEKLLEYFADEMPYGVAKCRTGEPDVWILDYLENV